MNEAGTAGSVGCPRLRQQWRKNVLPRLLTEPPSEDTHRTIAAT